MGAKGLKHWFAFIYRTILPTYFPPPLFTESVSLGNFKSLCRSWGGGGAVFGYDAPFSWNQLQNKLELPKLVILTSFKALLNKLEADSSICRCGFWYYCRALALNLCHFCFCFSAVVFVNGFYAACLNATLESFMTSQWRPATFICLIKTSNICFKYFQNKHFFVSFVITAGSTHL